MARSLTLIPPSIVLDGGDIMNVINGAELFNKTVPTAKITFTLQSVPGAMPRVYQYKIEAIDGRLWRQTLSFDSPNDPLFTDFNIPDEWRFSEFSQQRDVRAALIRVAGVHDTLEKITYDFT